MANFFKKLTQDSFDRSSTKKRIIRFVIIAILSIWAISVLFLMDIDNTLRPEILGGRDFGAATVQYPAWNGFQSTYIPDYTRNFVADFMYNVMNMNPHNVGLMDWGFLGTILVGLWAWAIYDCFDKKVRAKIGLDNPENPDYARKLTSYRIIIWCSIILVALLFLAFVIVIGATTNSQKDFSFVNFLLSITLV